MSATSHRWDQKLVLQALSDDVGRLADRGIPQPDIVLITGDIAFSGAQQEYEGAAIWLQQIADAFNLSPSDVMAIPGNHDVQRNIDVEDRQVRRLIDRLRNGDESLDDALGSLTDRQLLSKRFANYIGFTKRFFGISNQHTSDSGLYWYRHRTAPLGLVVDS